MSEVTHALALVGYVTTPALVVKLHSLGVLSARDARDVFDRALLALEEMQEVQGLPEQSIRQARVLVEAAVATIKVEDP